MAKSIGIDLGTTNSVAGIKQVQTEIIKSAEGDLLTPSCVSLTQKTGLLKKIRGLNVVVGRHALEWLKQAPESTVTAIKRLMGRSFDNPEVRKMVADPRRQFRITNQTRGTTNSLAVELGGRPYTPEQISAEILKKIRADAEKSLRDGVDYAVITVPAYFNDKQKHATRTAAALAGLKVRRLLPEPTAAAISFGVDTIKGDAAETVLIFDFGGGTFDLSVLTISGGQFIEQGKGGNMWLGGEDIDHKIADFVLAETAREYEIADIDDLIAGQDQTTRNRFQAELKAAVEKAKIELSDAQEAYVEILGLLQDADGDRIDVDVELTRRQFEQLIAPMIETCLELVRKLLSDIHFTPELIDKVLLVGGSSRIPAVIAALKSEFGPHKVHLHERPLLAIAEGAAILSHRLSDSYECPACARTVAQDDNRCADCGFDLQAYVIEEGVFDIVHTAAHDYYIYLENNEKDLMIEKNTLLPCRQSETFKLVHTQQQLVHMKFFNIVNDQEESIGDLWLGIDHSHSAAVAEPDAPLSVEITLKIDENNLVEVAAALKENPEVELSKTLSRGKADETLFLSLEALINAANQKAYSQFVMTDLTHRSVSIIKDIHRVIDKKTGEVIEPVYDLAKMKIDKADKMSAAELAATPTIWYAKRLLALFGTTLTRSQRKLVRARIGRLQDMDERGSFEQNKKAYHALNDTLKEFELPGLLMAIQKAADYCDDYEPAKADKFHIALENILEAQMPQDKSQIYHTISEILPMANQVLERYDTQAGTIYTDITR